MPRASRPTCAHIDLRAIHYNLRIVRKLIGPSPTIMPVVKANAYGHGIEKVSSYLEDKGFGYFGVANVEEGIQLREAGIAAPIHVFTLPTALQARLAERHKLEPTVATPESIRIVRSAAERARRSVDVHLKIETGMNRIGVRPNELGSILTMLGRTSRIRLKGVYTHLATADEPRSSFVGRQLRRFEDVLGELHNAGVDPVHIHAANSGAILRHPGSLFTMVRPGIMMYGYSPAGKVDPLARLRPAMRLESEISQVKRISRGESVSYGRTFRAKRAMDVGTIPIGYADGILRSLSNNMNVLVKGRRRPVIGRVCMDQIMIDCTGMDVRPGTKVMVFGAQGRHLLSAWEHAVRARTIPYELTCAVSARVPREYRV